jgi:hypothetical protein
MRDRESYHPKKPWITSNSGGIVQGGVPTMTAHPAINPLCAALHAAMTMSSVTIDCGWKGGCIVVTLFIALLRC